MILNQEELNTIHDTAHLVGFLPYLEEAIHKMENTLEGKVFNLLAKDELTPQLALFAWQEKLILRRLLRSFNQRVRVSQALGEQHQQDMEYNDA